MNNQIVVDTGPLVAILSSQDSYHKACLDTLKALSPPLLTTWPVITEALWLIRQNKKAIESLFIMIEGGLIEIDPLSSDNAVTWLKNYLSDYHDMGVQIADASLCYLAEIKNISTVFSLDRRDFSIYRIKGNKSLNIIP
jgi:predicted nucleic acid-binding protein